MAQSQKRYGVRHSVRAGSNPVGDFTSPPPHLRSHYTTGRKIIRQRKNFAAAEYSSCGGIFIWAGAAGTENRRKNLTVPKNPCSIC